MLLDILQLTGQPPKINDYLVQNVNSPEVEKHLIRRVDSLEKTDAGRDWGQEEKGTTEDEMAGWHH